jgi:TPP-dependent pyruvate/acetoin dehydrogenase alpha subunit
MFNVYKQTCLNRAFELETAKAFQAKRIKSPIYLGVGQEHIAACIYSLCPSYAVFSQHRCHSYALSYGVSPKDLAKELLGHSDGLNKGMGGSASWGDSSRKLFGHSGLLGDQVPIACGYALKYPTVCVLGDAAAEEDYALGSFGFAATHKLPILFVCEDNNLSILTEKKVRRSWNLVDVAKGFGLNAVEIEDEPKQILEIKLKFPMLVNIKTERHMWHAGVGIDGPAKVDRLEEMKQSYGPEEWNKALTEMEELWSSL